MAAKDRTLGLKLKAIDRMSTVIDRVQRKFPKLSRNIKKAATVSRIFNEQTKIMRARLKKIGGAMVRTGKALTVGLTLPLALLAAKGVKTFGDFQQGLRGIEKTTSLSREQVAKLGETFAQLSTEIPVSTAEMLELAQAGGQLGIKGVKNIEKFTITLAKLSRASDVVGQEGAKSIARILKVTGDGVGKVDRFSSSLVDLGNNAAASESEILGVAIRVAGQIGRFDVASDSVLGISTALRALGKRAESAGSVIGRAFDAIDQSIKAGGKQALILSKLTGIAVKDLKQQFQVDAALVFRKFIGGLSKVQKGGGNLIKVMAFLGLQGVRINDILGTLAKRPKVLAENMDRATRAFRKNTALQKEFEIQTDAFNSAMKVLGNTFSDVTRLIGEDLAPAVLFVSDIFRSLFNFLRENPTIRALAITFGILAAVIGPLLIILGTLLVMFGALATAAIALDIALLPMIIPALLITAAVVALIAVGVILVKKWQDIKDFFSENIFSKFLGFLSRLKGPLSAVATVAKVLVDAFGDVDKAGEGLNVKLPKGPPKQDDRPFFQRGRGGLGPAVGARKESQGAAQKTVSSELLKGNINVLFRNPPSGTKVQSDSDSGLGLDVGVVGGLL